jgi:hypothetical protein
MIKRCKKPRMTFKYRSPQTNQTWRKECGRGVGVAAAAERPLERALILCMRKKFVWRNGEKSRFGGERMFIKSRTYWIEMFHLALMWKTKEGRKVQEVGFSPTCPGMKLSIQKWCFEPRYKVFYPEIKFWTQVRSYLHRKEVLNLGMKLYTQKWSFEPRFEVIYVPRNEVLITGMKKYPEINLWTKVWSYTPRNKSRYEDFFPETKLWTQVYRFLPRN